MKITKTYLRKMIKEELEASMVLEADGETPEDVASRIMDVPASFRDSVKQDFIYMADGDTGMAGHYPHITDLRAFAREVLQLLGG